MHPIFSFAILYTLSWDKLSPHTAFICHSYAARSSGLLIARHLIGCSGILPRQLHLLPFCSSFIPMWTIDSSTFSNPWNTFFLLLLCFHYSHTFLYPIHLSEACLPFETISLDFLLWLFRSLLGQLSIIVTG